jgi:hypothetical protein
VTDFLRGLRDRYPDRGVALMSSLAEGADRVVAETALDLDISLTVLPLMLRDLYAGFHADL